METVEWDDLTPGQQAEVERKRSERVQASYEALTPIELLSIYTVVAEEGWDYDEFDKWLVLASSEEQALAFVRAHNTCLAHYGLTIDGTTPLQAGVAFASFHPG